MQNFLMMRTSAVLETFFRCNVTFLRARPVLLHLHLHLYFIIRYADAGAGAAPSDPASDSNWMKIYAGWDVLPA